MKNNLSDLNNYLFECIERLNDDELTSEQLEREIRKSDAVVKVASTIIATGNLALNAQKCKEEYNISDDMNFPLLGTK